MRRFFILVMYQKELVVFISHHIEKEVGNQPTIYFDDYTTIKRLDFSCLFSIIGFGTA